MKDDDPPEQRVTARICQQRAELVEAPEDQVRQIEPEPPVVNEGPRDPQ